MARKAVVIVPSEEDYKARCEAQEKAESKDVPDNAVMEMKGIEEVVQPKGGPVLNILKYTTKRSYGQLEIRGRIRYTYYVSTYTHDLIRTYYYPVFLPSPIF